MFNSERTFRAEINEEREKEIFLPNNIIELVKSDDPNNPLKLASERAISAGVDSKSINRYRSAVLSILTDRGSTAEADYIRKFGSPNGYFSPKIQFDISKADLPTISTEFKPNLSNDGSLAFVPFSEEMIEQIIVPNEADVKRSTEVQLDASISPYRKYLTKINGLMYLIHDAQHITQGIATGDKLNLIKEMLGNDLPDFDAEKAKKLIDATDGNVRHDALPVEQFNKISEFPLVYSIDPNTGNPINNDEEKINALLYNDEATMDTLADQSMREALREMPAFMLYLHNSMTLLTESLRWAKNELVNYVEKRQDGKHGIPEILLAIQEVTWQLDFMSRPYFAAFDDSDQALEYFGEQKEFLGKKVCGKLIQPSKTFDPFYLEVIKREVDVLSGIKDIITRPHRENILDEGEVLQPQDLIKTVAYPSGQIHIEAQEYAVYTQAMDGSIIFHYHPITKEGVEKGCNLISEVLKKGGTKEKLLELLVILSKIKISDTLGIAETIANIKEKFEIDVSDDDIKEMYGIVDYIVISKEFNSKIYNLQFYVRKTLIQTLEKNEQTKLVDILIRSCFFDPILSETEHYVDLVGLPAVFDHSLTDVEIIPKLIEQGDLFPTIYSINLEKLDENQKTRFSSAYKKALKSSSMTSEERVENLREFAKIKQEQNSTQAFAE